MYLFFVRTLCFVLFKQSPFKNDPKASDAVPDLVWYMFTFSIAGKVAIFKAVVSGDPAPTVTWARNKGNTSDPELYKTRFEQRSREHVLEVTSSCRHCKI